MMKVMKMKLMNSMLNMKKMIRRSMRKKRTRFHVQS